MEDRGATIDLASQNGSRDDDGHVPGYVPPLLCSAAMLPALLMDAIASGEVHRPDGTPTPLLGNVTEQQAQRLYDVVRTLRPEATIEIGLAHGISTLAIAQALHDNGHGVHHVVDPYQSAQWEGIGVANLERAGLDDRVRFTEAFPEEAIPTFPPAGFAFIDASHLFDLTLVDFVLVDKRLAIGGVIGFHDMWMASLRKAARYILANRSYRIYDDVPPRAESAGWQRKRAWSELARRAPRADRIFRPEVLQLLPDLGVRDSMIFIEKTGDDDRDWRFHQQF